MFLWTDERVDTLKQLWNAGIACAAIGDELGCSKNAVVGKAHRLKLLRRRMANTPAKLMQERIRARQIAFASAAKSALGVSILALETGMCKWPVGQNGEHLFCGKQWRDECGPYCAEHHVLAHEPTKRPRVRPPREPRRLLDFSFWSEAA